VGGFEGEEGEGDLTVLEGLRLVGGRVGSLVLVGLVVPLSVGDLVDVPVRLFF